jgi:starch synthase
MNHALQAFRDKVGWKRLMLNGMSKDFSWNASAKEYVKIYQRAKPQRSTQTRESLTSEATEEPRNLVVR